MLSHMWWRTFVQVHITKLLYPLRFNHQPSRAISNKYQWDDVIGIDMGTTYARVAVMEGEVPNVVKTNSGRAIPSLVAVDGEKGILVGEAAKAHANNCSPINLFFRMKDLIGRRDDDPETEKLKSMVSFKIHGDASGISLVDARNKSFSPTELCAFILDEMKKTAELYLERTISNAVIAVPHDFTIAQRMEMELAGNRVGLNVVHIIEEPIAAILSSNRKSGGVVVNVDMGGGKFHVSVLEICEGVPVIKKKCGDSFLGGDAFDRAIVDYLMVEIERVYSLDLTSDKSAQMRLKEAAEEAKVCLSYSSETVVSICFGSADGPPKHVKITISRSKFEDLVAELIDKVRSLCDKCLKEAKIEANEIDEVFLVGGMSRVPVIQQIVKQIFGKSPSMDLIPEEAVVLGAAIHGAVKLEEKKILPPGSLPLSIGVETWGATFSKIIPRNSRLPAKGGLTFSTEYDNQESLVFRILYGEGWMANNSTTRFLGELELTGIPPDPQGVPCVELSVDIDKMGLLVASAKHKGNVNKIEISVPLDLKHEHVWGLVKEAILNGRAERKQHRLFKLRATGTILIKKLQDTLLCKEKEIPDELRSEVRSAIDKFINVLNSEDPYLIMDKMHDFRIFGWRAVVEACNFVDHYYL